MMRHRSERIAGAVIVVAAMAAAHVAGHFRVAFLTDPIGPRAFPWLASGLLLLGGVLMLVRPAESPAWPQATTRTRIVVAVAGFLAYAGLLAPIGFIAATTLLLSVLALVFGGRIGPALTAAALLSVAMWLLFVQALGVPLPIGALFLRGG